jgi:PAS domain S-box-containing protein
MKDTWKIVLIDDEEDIRDVVALTLEDRGYRVATAGDGLAGLALVATFAPQIVITDIRMPKMDGLQVLAAVKAAHPTIEVIVITAFGEMDLAIAALQGDASDFITKPINDTALHLALDRACSRYTARKQVADYLHLLETQNARTAKELETAIGLQRNLIESSMDGIMCCGRDGEVLLVNRAMEQLLGLPRDEVVGKMQLDGFFETDTARRFHKDLEGKKHGGPGRLFVYETALKCRDGTTLPVEVSAVRAEGSDNGTGLVCFFRDIRKVRELERDMQDQARILHQDKMMSLGRLAASVVHEINNPLSGILNYVRLMARIMGKGPLDPERQAKFSQYIEVVEKETERVSRIVSGLLAFSRKSPPCFGHVAVDELLGRCLALSRHKLELQNIAVKESVPAGLAPVKGDFNQLQQCVINLIFNAIDAMPQGGTLTLSAMAGPQPGHVAIAVADTGCGIDPQTLSRIFEPFFTTKNEGYGVGLGLSTTYGIVQRHGGRIEVHSRVGNGTVVTLVLPAMGAK